MSPAGDGLKHTSQEENSLKAFEFFNEIPIKVTNCSQPPNRSQDLRNPFLARVGFFGPSREQ